ncbi:hypothetical protein [uncultured Ruminococcus sp.]|uniref:hypothetical protein n=1 Tax=uncultured Ruminococcus sp. TaxID=165186 RepID=UPI0025F60A5B|nr:hypothetical protein [uncultured Ruminococcus sp.]
MYGYDVKWEDSRKYITYICPNGRKCRDNKLHEATYRKENMEYEFEIRRNESRLQAELAGGFGHTDNGVRLRQQLAGYNSTAEIADRNAVGGRSSDRSDYDCRADETAPAKSESDIRSGVGEVGGDTEANVTERDGRGIEPATISEGLVITGWEAERADLIAAEMLRRAEQEEKLQTAHSCSSNRAPAPDIIGGIAAVASIIEDEPADGIEYAREHVERNGNVTLLE